MHGARVPLTTRFLGTRGTKEHQARLTRAVFSAVGLAASPLGAGIRGEQIRIGRIRSQRVTCEFRKKNQQTVDYHVPSPHLWYTSVRRTVQGASSTGDRRPEPGQPTGSARSGGARHLWPVLAPVSTPWWVVSEMGIHCNQCMPLHNHDLDHAHTPYCAARTAYISTLSTAGENGWHVKSACLVVRARLPTC